MEYDGEQPDKSSLVRAYHIVINNWTQDDYDRLFKEPHDYMIIGKEVASTGTPHLQAYIYKHSKIRFTAIKKRNPRANFKIAKGTAEHNRVYCSKDKDFIEQGTIPKQGKRTDLDTVATQITAGETTVEEILLTQPLVYHQYGRTLEKLEDLKLRKVFRKEKTKCLWIYGKTGTGKSHMAFEGYNPDTVYDYIPDGGWWEGYVQQPTVIINELRKEMFSFHELLLLIDQHPHRVRRRNRPMMPFTSELIIITSPFHPKEVGWYLSEDDDISQLLSRIEEIREIKGENRRKCV